MKRIILIALIAIVGICECLAWGQKGHDIVCTIAQRHITKKAQKAIADLLDGRSMVYWANWLDNASNTPEYAYSKTWHYKNIDAAETYENAMLNERGDVVRAAEAQIELLKDKSTSREDRQLALKILIHVVGDMHQPLHMGHRTDLGGNRWPVTFFRETTNLHSLWDGKLLESGHKWTHNEWADEIDRLSKDEQEAACLGTLDDWAKQTYEVCNEVYAASPESSELSYSYVSRWTPVVEQQLERGGLRLARLLNEIFK